MKAKLKQPSFKLHAESLLRIPLVNHLITQKVVRIVPRNIDQCWYYTNLIPISPVGFNPFSGSIFCANNSCFSKWHKHAASSARPYNKDEWLLYEVFFLIHDYLHVWAIGKLLNAFYGSSVGTIVLDKDTLSELEFIYITSEAVATVGLDFWYLAKTNLNSICPIDSRFIGLATEYRESDLKRYQKKNPTFKVQDPLFFKWILKGYCSSEFFGFSSNDLVADGKLMEWLSCEVRISVNQRSFARKWFSHLARIKPPSVLDRPISLRSLKRRRAADQLANQLWNIINGHELPNADVVNISFLPHKQNAAEFTDFRFTNIKTLEEWPSFKNNYIEHLDNEQFTYFIAQYLSSFHLPQNKSRLKQRLADLIALKSYSKIKEITSDLKVVADGFVGPNNLVLVN